MDINDLLMTALRAVIVYVALLFMLRVAGKREVGNFTAFDFLVALMLGEVVDEIIFGDVEHYPDASFMSPPDASIPSISSMPERSLFFFSAGERSGCAP